MIDNKETGLRIRAARESAALSVMKLARQVGVHRQTIYRLEDGSVEKISAELLNRVAEALMVKPEYLLGIDEQRDGNGLTEDEVELVRAYRMVDKEKRGLLLKLVLDAGEVLGKKTGSL